MSVEVNQLKQQINPVFVDPSLMSQQSVTQKPIITEEEAVANTGIEVFRPSPLFQLNALHTRPALETPKEVSKKALETSITDVSQLIEQIEAAEDDTSRVEAYLMKLLIASQHALRESREEDGLLSQETISKNQKVNKELQEEYFKNIDELIERSKASGVLDWIQWGLTGAAIVGGIASVAALFFSGGTLFPVIAAAWGGAATAGAGTVGLSRGIMGYQKNQVQGEIEMLQTFRELTKDKINAGLKDTKESIDFVNSMWESMRKVVEENLEAGTNQLR